jgi:hypothetical protein
LSSRELRGLPELEVTGLPVTDAGNYGPTKRGDG